MDRELFCIVNLQADLKPINMNVVSVGALDHAVTHPREVFKSAILSNAVGILMIHNHPSGSLTPSKADIAVTDRLRQAGAILGIQVYDHIITGRGQEFYSFMKQNLLRSERPVYAGSMDQIAPDGQMAAEQDAVMEHPIASYGKKENTGTAPLPVQGKDIDSILKSLETGVSDLFTSERYEEYLKTMAKFHNYSFNNTLLIAMQRPDATLVTGYRNWQSMGRQVMKGEKGITIIAPAPVKKKQKQEVLDRDHRPVLDENGVPVLKEVLYIQCFCACAASMFFMGILCFTATNLLRNIGIGIGCVFLLWLFLTSSITRILPQLLQLFKLSGEVVQDGFLTPYWPSRILYAVVAIGLLFLNLYLVNKQPDYNKKGWCKHGNKGK